MKKRFRPATENNTGGHMILGSFKLKDGTELKTHAASVVVTVDGDKYSLSEVLEALLQDPVETAEVAESDIEPATAYTVPQYIVGCGNISVFLNGMKLACGVSGGFVEVGDQDAASTTINFNAAVPSGTEIIVRVGR